MEEELLSIIDEIECLRRLDKYDENINTFVLIYRLEQQYQQILEKIKDKESKIQVNQLRQRGIKVEIVGPVI